jgi:hypothetical protein
MYSAYVLTKAGMKTLLNHIEPNFPDVIAHHVTVNFGIQPSTPIPSPARIVAIGYISDDSLEAVIVTVNGKSFRSDGKRYHITLSLDYNKGRRPVDSNGLIAGKQFTEIEPFEIETKPEILK